MNEIEGTARWRRVRVPQGALDEVRASFDRMPVDPYLEEGYRRRRLTRFALGEHAFTPCPPAPVMQTRTNNARFGGMSRTFAPLEASLRDSVALRTLASCFLHAVPRATVGWRLWVHQLRVAFDARGGAPTPEGPHRDERVWLGILVVSLQGVPPLATRLYETRSGPPIVSFDLDVGDLLVFEDATLFHDTAPPPEMTPARCAGRERAPAHRDVFLFALTEDPEAGLAAR